MRGNPVGTTPESILEGIHSATDVVLISHVHPDGDALGSLFGLARILEDAGKNVFCFVEEPVSYLFLFLPGADRANSDIDSLKTFIENGGEKVITIALDASDPERLGVYGQDILPLAHTIVIDHHQSHKDYGHERWVDADKSSTGEMVYELVKNLNYPIHYDAAVNLYVAICTDTGSFRYACTSPRTLRIAAELLELGVKPDEMTNLLYDNVNLPRLMLLQRVLSTLELHGNNSIALVTVTADTVKEVKANPDDVEGFIDYPRSLHTVDVAVFVKALKGNTVSVSLRSKGNYDVAKIAEKFGGGGHRNASGFRFDDKSIDEVKDLVLGSLLANIQ